MSTFLRRIGKHDTHSPSLFHKKRTFFSEGPFDESLIPYAVCIIDAKGIFSVLVMKHRIKNQ